MNSTPLLSADHPDSGISRLGALASAVRDLLAYRDLLAKIRETRDEPLLIQLQPEAIEGARAMESATRAILGEALRTVNAIRDRAGFDLIRRESSPEAEIRFDEKTFRDIFPSKTEIAEALGDRRVGESLHDGLAAYVSEHLSEMILTHDLAKIELRAEGHTFGSEFRLGALPGDLGRVDEHDLFADDWGRFVISTTLASSDRDEMPAPQDLYSALVANLATIRDSVHAHASRVEEHGIAALEGEEIATLISIAFIIAGVIMVAFGAYKGDWILLLFGLLFIGAGVFCLAVPEACLTVISGGGRSVAVSG
jgi:hypothetical protein